VTVRTLRKRSLEALSTIETPRRHYRDANGYVFLNMPVTEARADWVELTPEQYDAVRPLSDVDRRQWDAWHARRGDTDGAA
jgi:hypothetical protein